MKPSARTLLEIRNWQWGSTPISVSGRDRAGRASEDVKNVLRNRIQPS